MDINRIVLVALLGMALTACASTSEPGATSSKIDERNRMIAQMEEDRAQHQADGAARHEREAVLERQSEARKAQNRTPQQQ